MIRLYVSVAVLFLSFVCYHEGSRAGYHNAQMEFLTKTPCMLACRQVCSLRPRER